MPIFQYGGTAGTSHNLVPAKDFLVVRTRSNRSLMAGPVPRNEAAVLEGFDLFFDVPEAGVEVFKRSSSSRRISVVKAKAALVESSDVRFAGRVLMDEASGEPVIYTENLFIKFIDSTAQPTCRDTIANAGLTVKREISYICNGFFVSAPEGSGQRVFELASALLKRSEVELCHPELVRRKGRRQVFDQQWHLKSTAVNGLSINASANVEAAHTLSRGDGAVIAIIDDGVDVDHPEFSRSGKIVAPLDSGQGSNDPRPKFTSDNHGTACAGVACADGVLGASGVAPDARLMPIRNRSALGSQAEADAIAWAVDNGADVISCSWGPQDGRWFAPEDPLHDAFAPLPDSTRLAIDYAVEQGRGGKGCVIMWAAGNGNESVQNDGYARYEHVFAIAACNDRGQRCVYSDMGDAIFCAFPSSDFAFPAQNHPPALTPGIWTTDRRHGAGYNSGDASQGDSAGQFTNSFGGTSSAAPGAAGVAALVIAQNPALRWDQVGDIMRRACDVIDPTNGDYDNAGHSPLYGYGRINAETAARLAKPVERIDSVTINGRFAERIQDFRTTEVTLGVSDDRALVSVEVMVDIQHTYIGDLTVDLIPPAGSGVGAIVLHERKGRGMHDIRRTYDANLAPALGQLAGRNASGTWTLQVSDSAYRDQGVIQQFGLVLEFLEDVNRRKVDGSPQKRKRTAAAGAGRRAPAKKKTKRVAKSKVSKTTRSRR